MSEEAKSTKEMGQELGPPVRLSSTPLYFGALLVLLPSAAGLAFSLYINPSQPPLLLFVTSAASFCLGVLLLLYPSVMAARNSAIVGLQDSLDRAREMFADIETTKRLHQRAQQSYQVLFEQFVTEQKSLLANREALQRLLDNTKQLESQLLESNQERSLLRQRVQSFTNGVEKLATALENLERGAVSQEVRKSAGDLGRDLVSIFDDLGMRRIEPHEGDAFLPTQMEAEVDQVISTEYPEGIVGECRQYGFAFRDKVVRKARVVLSCSSPKMDDCAGAKQGADPPAGSGKQLEDTSNGSSYRAQSGNQPDDRQESWKSA